MQDSEKDDERRYAGNKAPPRQEAMVEHRIDIRDQRQENSNSIKQRKAPNTLSTANNYSSGDIMV